MSRPTFMTINVSALQHNVERVRAFAPHSAMIAMVKANAYGHGIERVALALQTVDALGVASLEEGLKLREAGITKPIVLMEGVFYPDELIDAAHHHFTLVVHHLPHVEMLEQFPLESCFSVWLKIDTGMHRLGIAPNDVHDIYQRLLAVSSIKKPIGLMTHFAEADSLKRSTTKNQIQLFEKITRGLPGPRSLANSAGILAWSDAHKDWVRPGLILYGASPFADKTGLEYGLKPVMTLSSRLIAITKVPKGEKVGYGGTWTAPEEMMVGVVGVGYGDGYPQYAENGTAILVNNKRSQLVGRVSMDMLTVDLRNQPEAKIGDEVTLWGEGLPVEEVAKHNRTSAYEILTRMTPRPKMKTVTEEGTNDESTSKHNTYTRST